MAVLHYTIEASEDNVTYYTRTVAPFEEAFDIFQSVLNVNNLAPWQISLRRHDDPIPAYALSSQNDDSTLIVDIYTTYTE